MKHPAILFFLLCTLASETGAQSLSLDVSKRAPIPSAARPGYFHNNLTSTGTRYFDAEPGRFNCLRTFEITWKLRTSDNAAAFLSAVSGLRSWHEADGRRTDVLVIQINAMPRWLSSSLDTARVTEGDNLRYYETVRPAEYARWDSLMRALASVIREWNVLPWYELWNEPDLHFWNGSEAELIELYRHTAQAIRSVDPKARIGGFGMNFWYNGVDSAPLNTIGYVPDSLVERRSALAHLIDSCAVDGTPLDFISWHAFSVYPRLVEYGYDFFEKKLAARGFPQTAQILTEYNASGSYRERKWHAPYILSLIDLVKSYPRFHHAFAAYQDFTGDAKREFFGEWGGVSRSGLSKPVRHALSLLSRVYRPGVSGIAAEADSSLTVFASIRGDTIGVLLSRYVVPPELAGYDAVLFGEYRMNTDDLVRAGYRSWAEIDSVFQGYRPATGDARTVAALVAGRAAYVFSTENAAKTIDVQVRVKDARMWTRGIVCRIDSTNNNVIFRYDSLLGAGYSREQAVKELLSKPMLEVHELDAAAMPFTISVPPNGIRYLELYADSMLSRVDSRYAPMHSFQAFPNPFHLATSIRFTIPRASVPDPGARDHVSLRVCDVLGREVAVLVNGPLEPGEHTVSFHLDEYALRFCGGVYFCRLTMNGFTKTIPLVQIR